MIKIEKLLDVTLEKRPKAIRRFLMKRATLIILPCTIRSRTLGIYFRGQRSDIYLAKFQ